MCLSVTPANKSEALTRVVFKRLFFTLSVLLFCALTPSARADVLPLAGTSSISANGHLMRLDDPQGALAADQALQLSTWRRLPTSLSAGYTADTVWLQVEVQAQGAGEHYWAMRLSNALLDDVRLYQRDAQGRWQVQRAGEDLARGQWPVDYRSAVFQLKLQGDQPRLLLLRLQSKNAMSVSLDFSPRQAFSNASRHEYLAYGLYFGVYLMLIGFHAVFWRMTRAPESGWYLCYVSCCVAVDALTSGLPQQLFGMPVALSDPLLGVTLALCVPIGVVFAGRQLGLPQVYPSQYRWLVRICQMLFVGEALFFANGHFREAMPIVQYSGLFLVPLFIFLALRLLIRGHRPARYFLLIFGIYYAGLVVSFLHNLGYLPANFWIDNAAALGTMIHMGLMSLRIISHYNRLKHDKERAQAQAAEQALQQNALLESLVAARVSELSREIGRRQVLEQELRIALQQEQRIRAQQDDFVAMVSHEFRTPLAIINTSAQQLARNLDAPPDKSQRRCQNIRDAGSRLLALVDDYLTHDRMNDAHPLSLFSACDLEALIKEVIAGFAPGRIVLDCRLLDRHYLCDRGLMQVAVRNLLANADRHAPATARITVEASKEGTGVCLSIFHPGEAIPEDECERLFDKYYRGRQAQRSSGAGLGLYMVQRIAQLHAGEVRLTGTGGQEDISFRMRLPLNHPQDECCIAG